MQNAFEQLCVLASRENWCWKIYCTTCGHLHFRYSFLELTHAKLPAEEGWLIHSTTTSYPFTFPRHFTRAQSERVIDICKEADLKIIASECKFPDWLGYIGLVVHHFGAADHDRHLSISWGLQLRNLVPPASRSRERLEAICSDSASALTIKDLEMIETDWRLTHI